MCAFRIQQKLFLLGLVSLLSLVLLPFPTPGFASDLTDPLSDVKFENTNTRGFYMESIDIEKVITVGSWIMITCKDPLSLKTENIVHRYLVLFSDDGNPADWEAAIRFTSFGGNFAETAWKVGEVTLEEAISATDWDSSPDQTYYTLLGDQLALNFAEYYATDWAEIAVWTEGISISLEGDTQIYHDWAPDSLEEWSFEAAAEVIIIDRADSSEAAISSSEPSAAIPGFGIIMGVMAISLTILARRKKNDS